jgi:Chalcone isomerase-like
MIKAAWLILLTSLCLTPAIAKENPAAEMKLVGQAKLSVLFWDVYDSSLYTPSGRFEGITAPLKLKLVYLRNITARELVDATREQWQKQGLYRIEHESWLQQLQSMWPDVKPGDSITLDWSSPQRSRFYFNEILVGSIESADFGQQFAAIWLSEKTEYPKVRKQLIGAPS